MKGSLDDRMDGTEELGDEIKYCIYYW